MRFRVPRPERIVAVVLLLAAVSFATWSALTAPEPVPSTSPSRDASADRRPAPTCAALRARQGTDPVGTCRTATALLTVGRRGRPLRVDGVQVEVREVKFLLATSPAGIARNRGRVTVRMTISNLGAAPVRLDRSAISLAVAGFPPLRVNPADDSSDRLRLDRPIPSEGRPAGTVRFETEGAITTVLARTQRADLGIRLRPDRVGVVRLRPRIIAP